MAARAVPAAAGSSRSTAATARRSCPLRPTCRTRPARSASTPRRARSTRSAPRPDFLGGRLYMTFALFDIKKVNALALVTCNPGIAGTCMQPVGKETSRGAEFEMDVRPVKDWQVVMGLRLRGREGGRVHLGPYRAVWSDPSSPTRRNRSSTSGPATTWGPLIPGLAFGVGITHVSDQAGNVPNRGEPEAAHASRLHGRRLRPLLPLASVRLHAEDRQLSSTRSTGIRSGSTLADLSVVPGALATSRCRQESRSEAGEIDENLATQFLYRGGGPGGSGEPLTLAQSSQKASPTADAPKPAFKAGRPAARQGAEGPLWTQSPRPHARLQDVGAAHPA
jgi:hypothetical protein